MHNPYDAVPCTDLGVAGATADALLHERDHFVYRSGQELALTQTK